MKWVKITLPIIILSASAAACWALIAHKPAVAPQAGGKPPPQVTVATARLETLRMDVASQGVVRPRTEIDLVSEVSGKVVAIHPAFVAGGFFKKGDRLIAIDPRDYDFAITKAQAQVAEARKDLLREEAEAEQAQNEWQALGGGDANDFVLHKPHLAERRAKLAAAEADLAAARLKRSRCDLSAPFAGRVREKQADIGQYVESGKIVANIYATDIAEVRLPVPSEQIEFLDLPLFYANAAQPAAGPSVTLRAQFAGKIHTWQGRIVRTEGMLDDKTGMLYAVAEIRDPYAYHPSHPPLAAGLFVQAEIAGSERSDLINIPRAALHGGYQVYVVDRDNRLRMRHVGIVRTEADRLVIGKGLNADERVLVSGIELPIDGMQVVIKTVAPGGRS
ncbi:efflux RND transporter periplasmic adaptor subunit [Methylomicrobium sp. Wu6]|uniref:efflux RND transporter periplasmic adaptor subunit n=1 Tax=Methylomicrobium sp. Wu6 TaxID=3107928 RepID=UPI002DD6A4A0|nr:efflux RND transporter periplasmic adaptor subunit [Methylomicrobium sp. Wu6]MEC4748529.1 efflux RND transporter periplasmic adaptor subunit [Methylomicrobium sp. Wu6]